MTSPLYDKEAIIYFFYHSTVPDPTHLAPIHQHISQNLSTLDLHPPTHSTQSIIFIVSRIHWSPMPDTTSGTGQSRFSDEVPQRSYWRTHALQVITVSVFLVMALIITLFAVYGPRMDASGARRWGSFSFTFTFTCRGAMSRKGGNVRGQAYFPYYHFFSFLFIVLLVILISWL